MMKLSTMYAIDRLTNPNWENPAATQILQHWEHDIASIQFFRSSANFVYIFLKGGRPYFLRFASSLERTREAIEAEIDIVNKIAIRFANLLTYTKLMRSVDIPDNPTYPEWLRTLRLKLTNKMVSYKASLR